MTNINTITSHKPVQKTSPPPIHTYTCMSCLCVLTDADVDLHVVAIVKLDGGQVVDVL